MIDRTVARLTRALVALAVAAASPAVARGQLATTNVQVLYGWDFDDPQLGSTATDGQTVLTVNHLSTWKYGDNFAFVDLSRAEYTSGSESNVYAEWHPRVFLNRLLGMKGNVLGIFRDFGPAFEINQGPGFYAYLAGLGGDLALPIPGVVGLNLFYRYDSLQIPGIPHIRNHTWQASPYWSVSFQVASVPFVFTGFVDVSGANDNEDVDVMAQPELLVDVLAPFGGPKGKLHAGIEWYLHYNDAITPDSLVSAPQAMIQWTLH